MRNRAFRFLWIGQSFANIGDVLYVVALIAAIYQLTGSPLQMSFVPFTITFSKFISSVIAPMMLDRFTLKNLLAFSQVLKTLLMAGLIFLIFWGSGIVWPLFVLAAFIAFLDGWALPASNALVPFIILREELMKTNGFLSTLDQSIQLAGWAAGGVITSFFHPGGTLIITTICYVISTFFMFTIPIKIEESFEGEKEIPKAYFEKVSEGWLEIWHNKPLRYTHIVYLLESAAGVVWIAAIIYLYVQNQLHAGEEWWGFLNSAFFCGLILASLLLVRMHRLLAQYSARFIWVCSLMTAIVTFWFGVIHLPELALILSLLFGFFDQLKGIILHTFVQMKTPVEKLPKVFAAQGAVTTLAFGLCSLAAGWGVQKFGIQPVFILSAVLLLISTIPVSFAVKTAKTVQK